MLIGRGDFSAKECEHTVARASSAPDDAIAFLKRRSDLHEELEKGLYELKLV